MVQLWGQERYKYFTSRIGLLDGVIAVSANQANFFREFNDNVFCVHHGIDVDYFKPEPSVVRDLICACLWGAGLGILQRLNNAALS